MSIRPSSILYSTVVATEQRRLEYLLHVFIAANEWLTLNFSLLLLLLLLPLVFVTLDDKKPVQAKSTIARLDF